MLSISTARYMPERNEKICIYKNLYTDFDSGIYNNQRVGIQMSTN